MNVLLDQSRHPVVGHRGNSAHAPENTLESFAQAIALGVDAIEFDVRLSSDAIPVVHHDPDVARTTDGIGLVAGLTAQQLAKLDAGARFTRDQGRSYPYRGKGIGIPRFEEVLTSFPSTPALIELKTPAVALAIRKVIEDLHAEDRCVVDSFTSEALRVFDGSRIAVGATRPDVVRLMREVVTGRPVTPPVFAALCIPLSYYGLPLPVRRFARISPSNGFVVHIWTINDPKVAISLWKSGVNGIISDDPGPMIAARASLSIT
ncbi:MAG TPA: glycerophosphodiester phosphodiesterase family protein [Gemmatimonadaceae bacterium]